MIPPIYIIGLILIPVVLLMGLLGWRFLGSGKYRKTVITKRGNYKALKTYKYKIEDFISPGYGKKEDSLAGAASAILNELVSEEEYLKSRISPETTVDIENFEENLFPEIEDNPKQHSVTNNSIPPGSDETALEPGVRQSITTDGAPEIEQVEGPAQSLFYNPLTAPAPTDNDKKNREAEIALKRRRRAELKNNTGSAKAGFSELFAPDSPVKASAVNGGAGR